MRFIKLTLSLVAASVIMFSVWASAQKPCFDGADGYTFFCGTSSADVKIVQTQTPAATKPYLKNVCGECAYFKDFDLNNFLNGFNAKVLFKEELSDSVNYYCSADLPYSVKIKGCIVNLHVCVRGRSAMVASPIIFGGY